MTRVSSVPRLSIVFLTYNRSDLLAVSVEAIRRGLDGLAGLDFEILICDDCSSPEHRARIEALPVDRIVWSERNHGLSRNHNKALAACRSDYVLSLQDDWELTGGPEAIAEAMAVLDADPEIGSVNFLPPPESLPHEVRTTPEGTAYLAFDNDAVAAIRATAARPYSDRPHLKRRAFIADLGPYREDLPMTKAELDFQRRVANQDRWRIAWLRGPEIFVHVGADRSFNPSQRRADRIARMQSLPVMGRPYAWLRARAKHAVRSLRGNWP